MKKIVCLLCLSSCFLAILSTSFSEAAACDAEGDVQFVCDQSGPEDLIVIPDSGWVIASGFPEGSGGLRVIHVEELSTVTLLPSSSPREEWDETKYGQCPGPIVSVEKERFSTHGLYVEPAGNSLFTVYAVHHGSRESIEVFEIEIATPAPILTWVGCVVAPEGLDLNSVVALPEGGVAATSFRNLGAPIEPVMAGNISGAIWEWHGDVGWEKVPGSDMSGPNGLELSSDGDWFYVGGWGNQSVVRLSRGKDPVQRAEVFSDFRVDNLRIVEDGTILAAGQGSKGAPNTSSNVARIDPDTFRLTEIIRHDDTTVFGTGTVAIEVGDEIWVGSLRGDRIARFQVTQ